MDATIVVIGGGPRGTGLLERLAAGAEEIGAGQVVRVHVVEPYTPGAGRIWRLDQSQLLWANSQAVDMTMFTDDSCTLEGPIRPGPTFLEWAQISETLIEDDEDLETERRAVHAMTFPSRPLLSAYLTWCFARAQELSEGLLDVRVHSDHAVRLVDRPDGRQEVHLAGGGTPLIADVVVLAQGHLPRVATGAAADLADQAVTHGLTYLPEAFTSEMEVAALTPGEDVIVRGAGLAFVDLLVRLTQGRGGRFETIETGPGPSKLRYVPSGREPRIHVGSRRGVPYHSKLTYGALGAPGPDPRYLTLPAAQELLARDGDLDFRADVYPLLVKELAHRHYHELFHAHPERVRGSWDELLEALDASDRGSAGLESVVASVVPDRVDRFLPEALDHPLAGVSLPSTGALQEYLKAYIRDDVDRHANPYFSPDLGVFLGLLAVLPPAGMIIASGRLSAASTVRDLPWFMGFFSFLASGPPPRRLEEMIALMDAGVLHFLGAGVEVSLRPSSAGSPAAYVATSPTAPGETLATALVEARIPKPSVGATGDELLASMHRAGAVAEHVTRDASGAEVPTGLVKVSPTDSRVIDAAGRPHPARYALGSGTSAATPGAFSRPGTNAAFFRQNDTVARAVLRQLAALHAIEHQDRRAG